MVHLQSYSIFSINLCLDTIQNVILDFIQVIVISEKHEKFVFDFYGNCEFRKHNGRLEAKFSIV